MHVRSLLPLVALAVVGACARKTPPPPPVASAPPPAAMAPAPMPAGARPGMAIPARLPDGGWATPNRNLSAAGTVWHLRSALNVAALACRGPQEAALVAAYNALLARQKPALATAEATLASEYRAAGGNWRDAYDDQMTRLYNFFAQDVARDRFCTAAQATLADVQAVPAAGLPAFAAERLPQLERPFTDFFAAYERWRSNTMVPVAAPRQVMAPVAPVPAHTPAAAPLPASLPAPPHAPTLAPAPAPTALPRLDVDVLALG